MKTGVARSIAWASVLLFIAGTTATVLLEAALDLSDENYIEELVMLPGFFLFVLIGALIVNRRPSNAVGWIMVTIGLITGVLPALETYAGWVMTRRGVPDPLATLGAWFNAWYWYPLLSLSFVFLPLVFPDGRLLSFRWRIPAFAAGIAVAAITVLGMLGETLHGQDVEYVIDNPIGIAGLAPVEDLPAFGWLGVGLIVGVVAAVASVVVRYRRGDGVERRQIKWFLFPVGLTFPLIALDEFLPDPLGGALFGAIVVGLPLTIGIAVFRYRLYEIDRIVSRTVSYGLLTAILIGVYVGLVFLLGGLLPSQGDLAVAGSTLAVAALFNPLRRRIQGIVDRRFNRSRYDASRTIDAFSKSLRSEVELVDLNRGLRKVVTNTMEPAALSIWLRAGNR